VLSEGAATKLTAVVGDAIILLASDAYGSFGAVELPLLGVTRTDPGPAACLTDLASMRDLVGVETGASEVALYLVDGSGLPIDPRESPEAIRAIETAVTTAGLEAERWDSESSAVASMLGFFDTFMFALYAIFVLVAGAGIANSAFLSVQDRTRDFATLRAVAFSARWVKAIVAIETLVIGTSASLAAAAASWAAIAAIGPAGLRLPESTRGIAAWMPESIPASVDPAALVGIVAIGCILPLVAAAYPLHVLGRMSVREALSYS
jgi:ABC-type lipoprotein release transport system permease subunit